MVDCCLVNCIQFTLCSHHLISVDGSTRSCLMGRASSSSSTISSFLDAMPSLGCGHRTVLDGGGWGHHVLHVCTSQYFSLSACTSQYFSLSVCTVILWSSARVVVPRHLLALPPSHMLVFILSHYTGSLHKTMGHQSPPTALRWMTTPLYVAAM